MVPPPKSPSGLGRDPESMRLMLQYFLECHDQYNVNEPPISIQEPLPLYIQPSDLEFDRLESVGIASTLQESVDPIAQITEDPFYRSTSSYEHAAGDFLLQNGTYPDEQTSSGSSTGLDKQLPLTVVQGIKKKFKCTWPRCHSSCVTKDILTRHVNEVHLRRIKAVCDECGKGFTRLYLKKGHNCRAKRKNC
ncbi:hypothetical protein BD769DRAFT_1456470 [Suillus cothurnatus]|nr:hypothetical protein BD769DRAFT_1456470 [Suillus cothurnatus]